MSFKVTPNADGTVVLSNSSTGKDLVTFDAQGRMTAPNGLDVDTATTSEAQAGTNDTKAITPLKLHQAILGGVEQSWQDVTADRIANVTYTNTTGKPIMVAISGDNSGAGSAILYINGTQVIKDNSASGVNSVLCSIVPSGATHSTDMSSIIIWAELR